MCKCHTAGLWGAWYREALPAIIPIKKWIKGPRSISPGHLPASALENLTPLGLHHDQGYANTGTQILGSCQLSGWGQPCTWTGWPQPRTSLPLGTHQLTQVSLHGPRTQLLPLNVLVRMISLHNQFALGSNICKSNKYSCHSRCLIWICIKATLLCIVYSERWLWKPKHWQFVWTQEHVPF